ncbi:hypothetical protein [Bradyrhizobium sp. CCBAU 11386]|uniref:hypothetical protein n=1 Tax=Bradyrhizobium sp. CCBAU 11386 TaxID=1630837 RepID=UPI0023035BC0|nr:hypothetical protein [Bradyrhizobium sp. CCBAU 11386]
MILLDSNVVSVAMKPEPHPSVRDWLEAQAAETAPKVSPDWTCGGAAYPRCVPSALNLLRVWNIETHRERCSFDTNKNANKSDGWERRRTNSDEHRCTRNRPFFKGLRAPRELHRTP